MWYCSHRDFVAGVRVWVVSISHKVSHTHHLMDCYIMVFLIWYSYHPSQYGFLWFGILLYGVCLYSHYSSYIVQSIEDRVINWVQKYSLKIEILSHLSNHAKVDSLSITPDFGLNKESSFSHLLNCCGLGIFRPRRHLILDSDVTTLPMVQYASPRSSSTTSYMVSHTMGGPSFFSSNISKSYSG